MEGQVMMLALSIARKNKKRKRWPNMDEGH
jgi:hypothetical protein